MADKPTPRGRGALLLEKLKKQQQEVQQPVLGAEEAPPKPRGRAQLLAKLKASRQSELGLSPGEKLFEKLEASISEAAPEKEAEYKEAEEALKDLSITESVQPQHYIGECGTKFTASANFIQLNIEQDRGIFEYEVKFEPTVDAKNNRIKLVNLALGEFAATKVFDGGHALFLPLRISSSNVIEVQEGLPSNPDEKIHVKLIYKKQCKLSDGPAIRIYNILLKRIMHMLLFSRMGRNYFNMKMGRLIPQHRLEIFPGYAVTAEEKDGGLLLCLDTQHKVLRNLNVYEHLTELRGSGGAEFKTLASNSLVGSIVLTKYNNKTYKIDEISWDMSPKSTFQTIKGEISFIDYYKNHHGIQINYTNQPLLLNRQTKSTEGGEKVENLVCLVPELCFFTGLSDSMRSDFKVMKDVAGFTRITPNQRVKSLRDYLEQVKNSQECQKLLKSWGVSISDDTIKLNARFLQQEAISFGDNYQYTTQDWNMLMVKHPVITAIDFITWVIFYTNKDTKIAQQLSDVMVLNGKTMGCKIEKPKMISLANDRSDTYNLACRNHLTDDVQVAVFICPSIREDRYATIKKACLCNTGTDSQVVLSKTLSNPSKQQTIISKIALQMNCKLGGALWSVKFPVTGWMCIGIDVYHAEKQRSVCGMVCSTNDSFTKWHSEATFQSGEIGDYYRMTFKKALGVRHRGTGNFPKIIIIIRDGVSEGQFDHVRKYEVPQFESVLQEMGLDSKIVFVIVQKRISTRIFKTGPSGYDNPPAGTVVDTMITHKGLYDFFLVPQTVRQGTVNPTHYIVIHDTYGIKPDHIQRFMYKMCHLYYNWSGTIRVPAPCQYAHKLASLIGIIQANPKDSFNSRLYYL